MLILISFDVQYSQKAVSSFEKGLNGQKHSSSGTQWPVKTLPPVKCLIPPLTPYRYLENHSECYFLKLKKLKHSWNPRILPPRPLPLKKRGGGRGGEGVEFLKFSKKRGRGVQMFIPIKIEGLVK